jgi:hypothetical protein
MQNNFIQKLITVRPNADVDFHFDLTSAQYMWKTYGRNAENPTLISETYENTGSTFMITRTWTSYEDYLNFRKDPIVLASIIESNEYNVQHGIIAQDISDMSQMD